MSLPASNETPAAPPLAALGTDWWRLGLITLAAACVVCFFFTPRFDLWRGLNVPEVQINPQINRAHDTLRQIADPLAPLRHADNGLIPSNQIIRWRLFFPLLAYAAHMPAGLFLALPQLGCLLALGLAGYIVRREARDWLTVFYLVTLLGTCDWFLVSSSWLAYFDSWVVLALLLVACIRSPWTPALACLIAPWIDERFIIFLPLAVAARAIYFSWLETWDWRRIGADLALFVGLTIPYVGFRVVLLVYQRDPVSTEHLAHFMSWAHLIGVSPRWYVEGFWMGLRGMWLGVGLLAWLWGRRQAAWVQVALLVLFGLTVILAYTTAGDFSRSFSMLIPLAFVGFVVALRQGPRLAKKILAGTLAFSLLTPAAHVMDNFDIPVLYLYAELVRCATPSEFLRPEHYCQEALTAMSRRDFPTAGASVDKAFALAPHSAIVYAYRALLKVLTQDEAGGAADVAQAFALDARSPDAMFVAALLKQRHNDIPGAIAELIRAQSNAPPDWLLQDTCTDLRKMIEDAQRVRPPATRPLSSQ